MDQMKREHDKMSYKLQNLMHAFSLIIIGFFIGKYSIEHDLFSLFGSVKTEILNTIDYLGGLPVIGSFIALIFGIRKKMKGKSSNGNNR